MLCLVAQGGHAELDLYLARDVPLETALIIADAMESNLRAANDLFAELAARLEARRVLPELEPVVTRLKELMDDLEAGRAARKKCHAPPEPA
jgi:hypothetical protein